MLDRTGRSRHHSSRGRLFLGIDAFAPTVPLLPAAAARPLEPAAEKSARSNANTMAEFSRTSRAQPVAPYSSRPPSPPSVHIPGPPVHSAHNEMTVVPSYANVDPAQLTMDDLAIITGGKAQSARDTATNWNYADRRTAQPVLDFLFLGPSSIARDRAWLRDNGITMLLAARDARMAEARLMFVDKVAQEMGIHAEHVDVTGNQDLIAALPGVIRSINDHILAVYRRQAQPAAQGENDGGVVVDWGTFKRAKVLIFCETGNERSATIVIAYLMTVFGMDMVQACQFVHYRRFCISMDEDMKWLLQTFEGILSAKKTVNQQQVQAAARDYHLAMPRSKAKRGYDEAVADDSDGDESANPRNYVRDKDRYRDRAAFVPFVDSRDDMME